VKYKWLSMTFVESSLARAFVVCSVQGHVPVTQKFMLIFCWAEPAHPAEHSRKMLLGFEAGPYSNLKHAHLARLQHLFRTLRWQKETARSQIILLLFRGATAISGGAGPQLMGTC
jgi:hypothetical protein